MIEMDNKRFLGKLGVTIPTDFVCPFYFENNVYMLDKPGGGERRIDDLTHCGNPALPINFAPNSFSEKWFFPVRFASIKDAIYGI
jgi:hypothetical protein